MVAPLFMNVPVPALAPTVRLPCTVVVVVVLPSSSEVAVVVPMFNMVAVAVSRVGVRTEVSARPVPEIQKLLVDCWMVFWFWIPLVEVRLLQLLRLVHISALAVRAGMLRV